METHGDTLKKFLRALKTAHHLSQHTVTGYRWKLAPMFEAWADVPMADWDYGLWEDYLGENPDWKPRTIKKLTSHSRMFIKWCARRKIPCGDFIQDYQPPQAHQAQVPVAKTAEVRTLIKEAPNKHPRLELAIGLAAYAGLRRSEIGVLTWGEVDLRSDYIKLRSSPKTGKPRDIPILSELRVILEKWKPEGAKPNDPVLVWPCFGGTTGNGNRDLTKLQDWCGTPKMGWHAFRHHFGTMCVRNGVGLEKVRDWMGHGSLAITSIYVHSSPDGDHEALEAAFAAA